MTVAQLSIIITIIIINVGANFSFHKEKAKAIPEQGHIVSVFCH